MNFNRDVLRRRRDQMNEMGVKIQWIGRPKRLWSSVIKELEEAARADQEEQSSHPQYVRELRRAL